MDPSVLAQTVDPDRAPRIFLANEYPKQLWYFLATFLALVAICHFVSVISAYFTRQHVRPKADAPLRHGVSWDRLPLAFLELFRTITFRWSITIAGAYTLNVADFVLAAMYLTILFTWTFINSKNHLGQKYDPKYWANRCAHIAGSQLPLMAAFGMKNNIISILTGVSFDKLEHLHRVTARVICVMLWVHAFGRIKLDLADAPSEYWFKVGVMGASALTLLCFLSVRPVRSRNYEVFLYFHLVLGVITLAGAYIHATEFGYGAYIWPAFFLWGLDRTLRLTRIFLVNSQLFHKIKPKITSTATVSIISPHFLRVLVEAPPYFRWQAGQSAYITICGAYPTSFMEPHPFTIANAPLGEWTRGDKVASSSGEPSPEEMVTSTKEKESSEGGYESEDRRQLMFILRVREGYTKRLLDSVVGTAGDGSKAFKAFVDGPYSSPPVVRGFETVLFICGGSGVSFALPLFLDLLQAARANANPRCNRVVFVWAIRESDQIKWIANVVTHALLDLRSGDNMHGIEVEICLHVTAASEYTQSIEDEERASGPPDPEFSVAAPETSSDPEIAPVEKAGSTTKQHLLSLPGVTLVQCRPDIPKILGSEIDGTRGAVSINVCGTTELAQSVRNALRNGISRFGDILRGGPSVSLHVEGFGSA
ncbi:ferric reductase NAD binding domain-containing protein [Mycena rosella]|uniref:Ferric reductase NAD binding domain-containing protein n=1 Tax=Mycena rosella TaxID=1033263 RepID=A0AAD7D1Y4_MYCRO|nr:ferric reductase NAD binding domain-containing protein [Mycena rosella]